MKHFDNKLVVLRGNSGSGKSTVAKKLREQATSDRKIAIVEQDYLRRFILKERKVDNGDNIDLIQQTVEFALKRDYYVILEGILWSKRYSKMLHALLRQANETFVYYIDVSIEGTLERHKTKHNAHEYGEKEMREWYINHDVLGTKNEVVIPESSSMEETVKLILMQTGLVS